MSLYVVDAGKWFRVEPDSDKAGKLLELFQQRAVEWIAPDLLIAEAANVFWKHAQRSTLTAQEAQSNLHDLLTIQLAAGSGGSVSGSRPGLGTDASSLGL